MSETDLPVVVYSADSAFADWQKIWAGVCTGSRGAFYLGWRLALRDLRAQYRQTVFGLAWLFLPVVLTTLLFVFLNSARLLNVGEIPGGIPYPLYAFLGSLFWQTFVDSLTKPLSTVTASRGLVAKIQFPREALLISAAFQVLFNLAVKLVVALPLVIWFVGIPPVTLLLSPLPLAGLLLLGFAIGQLLIPINLIFRDIQFGVRALLGFLVFTVPVGYSPEAGSLLARIVDLNPVTPLLRTARDWLTIGGVGDPGAAAIIIALAALAFAGGLILYLVFMPIVIERQSA